jgi:GNAT superfamily N-acetyltransferase
VTESERRRGYGGELLARAEAEARQQACRGVHLDTHQFQAPDFYLRRGYQVFGVLEDYPAGARRYFLAKKLRWEELS